MKISSQMKPIFLAVALVSGVFLCARSTAQNESVNQGQSSADSVHASPFDFTTYRTQIEPIFLKERPGHARCYGCHTLSNRIFHLEALLPGSSEWTPDQSRHNFDNVVQLAEPGQPASSKLLLHPLSPEAGGDAFHSGGRQFASQNDPDWMVLADWVRNAGHPANTDLAGMTRIYVTNSAGDTIDVIYAATNKVVQVIHGIELPHGIAFSPDGSRVYVSNESESVLDVVDRKSGEILKKVALTGRPNNIAITPDGKRVLVGIRAQSGFIDVIDTETLTNTKSIPVNGSVHNVYVTPDGKFAVSGSIENKAATVVDLQTDQVIWGLKFDHAVRPMTFETNPDGSTRRIFVQLSNFHGFAVVDFAKRAEVARIHLPTPAKPFGTEEGRAATPSHGIAVSPEGGALWVNSTFANAIFKYSLPDLKLVGYARLPEVHPSRYVVSGSVPEWITFGQEGKTVYVSNSAAGSVSVIDTRTLREVALVPVGEVPKRINTLTLH